MKKIEAIIRPEKLDILRQHLEKIGYPGMMITKIEGHGKQGGIRQTFRGQEFKAYFLAKLRIEIVTTDAQTKKLSDAIVEVCRSGAVGDGKIFITDVADAIRIRTGESGDAAI